MADQARAQVKDHIIAPYIGKIDQCQTVPEMVPSIVTVIKELAEEILTNHHLYLSTV